MCDFDSAAEFDTSLDLELNDNSEDSFETMDDIETLDYESLPDVEDNSSDFDRLDDFQDIEPSLDDYEAEEISSELSEFEDVLSQEEVIEDTGSFEPPLEEYSLEVADDWGDAQVLSDIEDVEPEVVLTQEELERMYEAHSGESGFVDGMRELLSSGRVALAEMEDTDESVDEGAKVLSLGKHP